MTVRVVPVGRGIMRVYRSMHRLFSEFFPHTNDAENVEIGTISRYLQNLDRLVQETASTTGHDGSSLNYHSHVTTVCRLTTDG